MMRRLFAVWPPAWALATAGTVYLLFQGLNDAGEVLQFVAYGFVGGYAFYRVAAFHPGYRAGYYFWLRGTPWSSRKPLPMGPVHLVWQDAALLAIVYALTYPRSGFEAIRVVQIFLVAYILLLGSAHYWTGQKAWGYATMFAAGFLVLFLRDSPWQHFVVATTVAYSCGFVGLRVALARFPWEDAKGLQKTFQAIATGKQDQKDIKLLGWPYDRLGPPNGDEVDTPWDVKYILGILLAWWFFVGYMYMRNNWPDGGYLIYYGYMISGVIGPTCAYCIGYAPPINIWGRIATGRLIIPGYDHVIVAPATALVVGVVAWYVPGWLQVPPIFVTPVAFVITWWILMAMPPSLRQWRLTGNHRIVPVGMSNVQSTQ